MAIVYLRYRINLMAVNKKDLFDVSLQELADFANALSHPARIEILTILVNQKSCICNSIVEKLPLSQSTISQHLKVLKNTGLILGEIDGQKVCYCINKQKFQELSEKTIDKLNELSKQINI